MKLLNANKNWPAYSAIKEDFEALKQDGFIKDYRNIRIENDYIYITVMPIEPVKFITVDVKLKL